jgi:hypothetical protein
MLTPSIYPLESVKTLKKMLVHLIRRPQVLPVRGGEVVEREQRVTIFGQAFDRLVVFRAVGFGEGVESRDGILLRFGHPDLLQRAIGLGMQALRQLLRTLAVCLRQRSCSSLHASLRRAIVEADRPGASLPTSAASASSKSPVETPFR